MLGYVREHHPNAAALRLAWIYRPGLQTPTSVVAIMRGGMSGTAVKVDAGPDDITHYLSVTDAVNGLLCAGQAASLTERVCTISAGPGVPMREMVVRFLNLAPKAAIALAENAAPALPEVLDNRRAARDLGFCPMTSLEEGLRLYRDALSRQGL